MYLDQLIDYLILYLNNFLITYPLALTSLYSYITGSVGSLEAQMTEKTKLIIYSIISTANKNNPKSYNAHARDGKSNTIVAKKFNINIANAKHCAKPQGH